MRSRYEWKQNRKNGSTRLGLEKVYWTLFFFVINGSSLDDLVFTCVRKRKKLGKRYQQLTKWEPNRSKIKLGGNPWGGQRAQGGGQRGGKPKNLYFWSPLDRLWSLFGATNAKMGALLDPTRFRRSAKIKQFHTKSIQSLKKLWPGTFSEKTSIFYRFSILKQGTR